MEESQIRLAPKAIFGFDFCQVRGKGSVNVNSNMSSSSIVCLDGIRELIEELPNLRDTQERADRIADHMAKTFPSSPLICMIKGPNEVLAVAQRGIDDAEKITANLPQEFKRWAAESASEPAITVESRLLRVYPIGQAKHFAGALAFEDSNHSRDNAQARDSIVRLLIQSLGLFLQAEACHRDHQKLTEGIPHMPRLCTLAEVTEALAHEFNNVLNNIQLHLAILEQKGIPDALRVETKRVRVHSSRAASLIQKLQQLSRHMQPQLESVDVNKIIQEVVAEKADARIRLDLAEELPLIRGTPFDVRQLVNHLTTHSLSVLPEATGNLVVKTERHDNLVVLEVEDSGPQVGAEELRTLFEPFTPIRSGDDGLRLSLCKAIVRRLQWRIQAANRADRGMSFQIELYVA